METDDIAVWLTAIWDQDVQLAQKATPGPWRHDPRKHWRKPGTAWFEEAVFAGPAGKDAECIAGTGESDDPQSIYDAAFIAAHDPASVLARIAADRKLLELHAPFQGLEHPHPSYCEACGASWPCATVRLLALPHADRPGYNEQWRP